MHYLKSFLIVFFLLFVTPDVSNCHETWMWQHAEGNIEIHGQHNCESGLRLWKLKNGMWLPIIFDGKTIHIGTVLVEEPDCDMVMQYWRLLDSLQRQAEGEQEDIDG